MSVARFNVRVYGLLFHAGRVLVSEEVFRNGPVTKFPGGGLRPGEGTLDGLKREVREELGMEAMDLRHFYTTDFFQPSALDGRDQIISIYYTFSVADPGAIPDGGAAPGREAARGQRLRWLPLHGARADAMDLPIDRVVLGMVLAERVR